MTVPSLRPAAMAARGRAAPARARPGGRAGHQSGAPVFVNDRAVGLVADQDGGSRRSLMPVDDLAEMLASEPLAALH